MNNELESPPWYQSYREFMDALEEPDSDDDVKPGDTIDMFDT